MVDLLMVLGIGAAAAALGGGTGNWWWSLAPVAAGMFLAAWARHGVADTPPVTVPPASTEQEVTEHEPS